MKILSKIKPINGADFKIADAKDIAIGDSDVEEKILGISDTVDKIRQNFVTPEMFGAVGDGKTDDTQSFISMFQTSKKIELGKNKIYLVNGIFNTGNDERLYLEGNGATLKGNFSICCNMNENVNDWNSSYSPNMNIIQNITFLQIDGTHSSIIQGGYLKVLNSRFYYGSCCVARADEYIDLSVFVDCESFGVERWIKTINKTNKQLEDRVSAGDNIVFERTNMCEEDNNNHIANSISFGTFSLNFPVVFNECIGASATIKGNCHALFKNCHMERPKGYKGIRILNTNKHTVFDNCYFYLSTTNDTKGIFKNCFIESCTRTDFDMNETYANFNDCEFQNTRLLHNMLTKNSGTTDIFNVKFNNEVTKKYVAGRKDIKNCYPTDVKGVWADDIYVSTLDSFKNCYVGDTTYYITFSSFYDCLGGVTSPHYKEWGKTVTTGEHQFVYLDVYGSWNYNQLYLHVFRVRNGKTEHAVLIPGECRNQDFTVSAIIDYGKTINFAKWEEVDGLWDVATKVCIGMSDGVVFVPNSPTTATRTELNIPNGIGFINL